MLDSLHFDFISNFSDFLVIMFDIDKSFVFLSFPSFQNQKVQISLADDSIFAADLNGKQLHVHEVPDEPIHRTTDDVLGKTLLFFALRLEEVVQQVWLLHSPPFNFEFYLLRLLINLVEVQYLLEVNVQSSNAGGAREWQVGWKLPPFTVKLVVVFEFLRT